MYMSEKIRIAAQQMSNVCYNLKQDNRLDALDPRYRHSMALSQEAFDAAMREQREKENAARLKKAKAKRRRQA